MQGNAQRKVGIMTLTYSIDHALTSVEDVSVEVADKASLVHQATKVDPKTGAIEAVYVIANGDTTHRAFVTYRVSDETRKDSFGSVYNIRRFSITLNTWAVRDDSVAGTSERKPLTASISFNVPTDFVVEVADLDDVLGNLFSFAYLSVTTKVRDTSWLSMLLFGTPEVK